MTDKAKANLTRLLQSPSRQSKELGKVLLENSNLTEEEKREIAPDYVKIGGIWFEFICDPAVEEAARLNPFDYYCGFDPYEDNLNPPHQDNQGT